MSALMMWRSDIGWGIIAFQMDADVVEYKQKNRNIEKERKIQGWKDRRERQIF